MTGTGPRHHAVNTLAPTPVQIPDDPAERALYFAALSGGGGGGAQPRPAAGQDQPRNAADALMAELKRQAEEKAKQGPPRERDDDRGKDRDR